MDKLNEYLQKVVSLKASELHLEPNKIPYVLVANDTKEIDSAPILGSQISVMIFPLIPNDVKFELPNKTEVEFEIPHKFGRFRFLVKKSPLGFNVTIRPAAISESNQKTSNESLSFAGQATTSQYSNTENTNHNSFHRADIPKSSIPQPEIIIENLENTEDDGAEDYKVEVTSLNDPEFTTKFSDNATYEPPLRPQEIYSSYDEIKISQDASKGQKMTETTNPAGIFVQGSDPKSQMESMFYKLKELGASDLHLSSAVVPIIRKDGKIMPFPGFSNALSSEKVKELLLSIMPQKNKDEFNERNDTDFSYEIPGVARFRVNIFRDRKGMGGVFRLIPTQIISPDQLGLSKAVTDLCFLPKGLIVVTGPTGSGKSTTLASLVDFINQNREDHIITIEDPIEFVHENKKCLVNQREVHSHTRSFKDALRAALREDPDIVLVGEMRDLETIAIAIETAETGHLVFGTLHTSSAASTVDRIIDQFPSDRQQQIRVMLSESLRAVIAQTLLPKKGGGRVAAFEILIVTHAISNLIREGKTFQIPSVMQTGKSIGMVTLNDSLLELVKKGIVEPRDAYLKAVDKTGFETLLQKNGFRI